MENKLEEDDDHEPGPGPVPPLRLDRFGFLKSEVSPQGLTKSRSAFEYER